MQVRTAFVHAIFSSSVSPFGSFNTTNTIRYINSPQNYPVYLLVMVSFKLYLQARCYLNYVIHDGQHILLQSILHINHSRTKCHRYLLFADVLKVCTLGYFVWGLTQNLFDTLPPIPNPNPFVLQRNDVHPHFLNNSVASSSFTLSNAPISTLFYTIQVTRYFCGQNIRKKRINNIIFS